MNIISLIAAITELISVAAPGISEVIKQVEINKDPVTGDVNLKIAIALVEDKINKNINDAKKWLEEHNVSS